jgi:prepilin-type N-terminal cleavage/methylation domain-containing protein
MHRFSDIRRVLAALGADDGFSLTELMVVLGIMVFIIGTAFMAFNAAGAMSDGIQAREQAATSSALALERVTAEMRQARQISDGSFAFKTTAPDRAVFYVDLDHTGAPERVTYYVSGGALYRTQAQTTMIAPVDANYGPESTPQLIVRLDPTWATVFAYYNNGSGDYSAFTAPVAVTSPDLTTAVQITIKSKATVGVSTMTGQASSMVNIRSTDIILNGS